MDQQLIIELTSSIDHLTYWVRWSFFLLLLIFLVVIGSAWTALIKLPSEKRSTALDDAEFHLERGNYIYLKAKCEDVLGPFPNSVEANWYLALCHYHLNDYQNAIVSFETVTKINPSWKDVVHPYLEEIGAATNDSGEPSH